MIWNNLKFGNTYKQDIGQSLLRLLGHRYRCPTLQKGLRTAGSQKPVLHFVYKKIAKGTTDRRIECSWQSNYPNNLQQANPKSWQTILETRSFFRTWLALVKLSMSAVTNNILNVSIRKSDKINKFSVGIFNSKSHIIQVSKASVTDKGRQWLDSGPIKTLLLPLYFRQFVPLI